MTTDPKKEGIDQPRGDDNWGPGQLADGSFNMIPEEELAKSIAQRDADEAEFDSLIEGFDLDDISDLDDEVP